jgi:hypothetical protein
MMTSPDLASVRLRRGQIPLTTSPIRLLSIEGEVEASICEMKLPIPNMVDTARS